MSDDNARYTHGHEEPVLDAHADLVALDAIDAVTTARSIAQSTSLVILAACVHPA